MEQILIPTDGSEGSNRAIDYAINVADLYDASLHVLFVIDTTLKLWDHPYSKSVVDHVREIGRKQLLRARELGEKRGLEVETEIKRSPKAHEEITSYADEKNIDLIVMGTHGRSGLERMMIGSTTERVLRTATRPVITVPMNEEHTGDSTES